MKIKNFIKTRQQTIVLGLGYVLVAGLAFGIGRISASSFTPPEIKVEEAFVPLNNTPELQANQLATPNNSNNPLPAQGDCAPGQIKGNISSSGKVYHKPGGSFYNRTKAEQCFKTEAEAAAAGFRPSNN